VASKCKTQGGREKLVIKLHVPLKVFGVLTAAGGVLVA
jgi:hypothetical protein